MRSKLTILYFLILVAQLSAQKNKMDSLRKTLTTANDTGKVLTLIQIGRQFFSGEHADSAINYLQKANDLAEDLDYPKGLKEVNVAYSIYQFLKNDFDKSIEYAKKAQDIKGPPYTKLVDADAYTLLANAYMRKNMYEKSITCYHLALPTYEKLKDKKREAVVLNNIGNIFYERGSFKEAINYYSKSIELKLQFAPEKDLIPSYNNLGNSYNAIRNTDKALECQQKALDISLRTQNEIDIAGCYSSMGGIYYDRYDYEKALYYRLKALNVFRNTDYLIESASCYLGCAQCYCELKNPKLALQYTDSAKTLADSTGYIYNKLMVYRSIAEINKMMGNYKAALENYELATKLKDSLSNEETNKMVTEMQTKYDSEKKDIEILVQKTEIEKQNTQRNGLIIGSVLLSILLIFMIRSFYQKKKDNRIITAQKTEVEQQKALVEEHRKELIDSIHYAERIQKTLMPSERSIEKNMDRLKNSKNW